MNAKDLEFLQEYLEKVTNTAQLIKMVGKDPTASVHTARGMEADLRGYREACRDKILDVLVRDAVERAVKEIDDGL